MCFASAVSASACHIGGPNSVNPGQIVLVYGKYLGRFLYSNVTTSMVSHSPLFTRQFTREFLLILKMTLWFLLCRLCNRERWETALLQLDLSAQHGVFLDIQKFPL